MVQPCSGAKKEAKKGDLMGLGAVVAAGAAAACWCHFQSCNGDKKLRERMTRL